MNALSFTPTDPTHFAGPAHHVALQLERLALRGGNHRLLLKGPPGTGKTALANWFARRLILGRTAAPAVPAGAPPADPAEERDATTHPPVRSVNTDLAFNLIALNGTQVNVEAVDRFSEHIRYTSIGYRCILIDEADAIPPTAQTRMLSFLDTVISLGSARVPRAEPPVPGGSVPRCSGGIAVICTSNYDFDRFPERLQTRFKPFDVPGPSDSELIQFLQQFSGALPLAVISDIATQSAGNVRQALEDLDTALLAAPLTLNPFPHALAA